MKFEKEWYTPNEVHDMGFIPLGIDNIRKLIKVGRLNVDGTRTQLRAINTSSGDMPRWKIHRDWIQDYLKNLK